MSDEKKFTRITSELQVSLSFKERFFLIFGGKLNVKAETVCQYIPPATLMPGDSKAWVENPFTKQSVEQVDSLIYNPELKEDGSHELTFQGNG